MWQNIKINFRWWKQCLLFRGQQSLEVGSHEEQSTISTDFQSASFSDKQTNIRTNQNSVLWPCDGSVPSADSASLPPSFQLVGLLLIGVAAWGKGFGLVSSIHIIGGVIAVGVFLLLIAIVGLIGAMHHHQVMLFFVSFPTWALKEVEMIFTSAAVKCDSMVTVVWTCVFVFFHVSACCFFDLLLPVHGHSFYCFPVPIWSFLFLFGGEPRSAGEQF